MTLAVCLAWFAGACVDDTLGGSQGVRTDGPPPPRLDRPDGDVAPDAAAAPVTTPWAIAVVGTDYTSTSVSIVARESQTLFRENVVHSGSATPGLSVALSGDVTLPRAPNPYNRIVLLDRYPNGALVMVSPEDFSVTAQLSVATGFASNPHDFLWLEDDKAYVTRYEKNPRPGLEPYDEGDDILIIDPTTGSLRGRIPLGEWAGPGESADLQSRPNQMAWAGGLVFVSLNHLSGDFKTAGDGRLAIIDPARDEVIDTLTLPGFANCGGLVHVAARESLYVSCSGLFAAGRAKQVERSGIVAVDLSGAQPETRLLRHASDDGAAQPYGLDLDVAAQRWLIAVRFGDLASGEPDRLVAIDLAEGGERVVHEAGSAYGLGGVLVDDATDTLYVGDADHTAPVIQLYRIAQGAFTAAEPLTAHPTVGLPPRQIRFY